MSRGRLAPAAGFLALATACGGDPVPVVADVPLQVAPTLLRLMAGDSTIASASVAGALLPARGLVWSSSDSGVIVVRSQSGDAAWIRARDAGAAVLSVELAGRPGTRASLPVTAVAPCVLGVPMGRPELAALTLQVGRTGRPNVVAGSCLPGGDPTLVYESSDSSIVAIDPATRLPVGRAPGQATLVVRLRAAPSARVTVPASVWRCGGFEPMLTVQPSALTLAPGESARLAINVPLAPGAPAGERPIPTLVSSDPAVAVVTADGTVRAIGPGTAVVTVSATTPSGCGPFSQAVTVAVRAP